MTCSRPCKQPPARTASRSDRGQVALKLKTFYRDGTSYIVRVAARIHATTRSPVPRPRLHLIRFHGVLAPNARLESMVALGDQRTAASEKCDRLLMVGYGPTVVGEADTGAATANS
jgi:hypothetical protein